MALPNVFATENAERLIDRINQLNTSSQPQWGKMSIEQMLAHCNVTYEMIYTDKHPKPNFLLKAVLKTFLKPIVTNEKPYKHNSGTASQFIIKDDRAFDVEKSRLINYIRQVTEEGEASFEGKVSHSFGNLNANEWNNMLYKHLDHHLNQFGV